MSAPRKPHRAKPFRAVIEWRGRTVSITYIDDWLGQSRKGVAVCHLEVETLDPKRAPLPITETGYRSHFTHPDTISLFGGPVAFVRLWLDDMATRPQWKAFEQADRQLSLF